MSGRKAVVSGVCAVLALLLVVPIASPASSKVYFRLPLTDKPVVKPHRIDFSDAHLTRLQWHRWGKRSATGRGRARVNTCDPSCADGNYARGRVTVRMFKRHREGTRRVYGCMTAHVRGVPRVVSRLQWGNAC